MENEKIKLIKGTIGNDGSILSGYLFGSHARGRQNKYSDVDIAVLFDEKVSKNEYMDKQIALIKELSEILGKETDVVVLNNASLFLKFHILKDGIKIYERPHRNEHGFEALAIIEYFDFLPIKNRIENGLLSKIKGA